MFVVASLANVRSLLPESQISIPLMSETLSFFGILETLLFASLISEMVSFGHLEKAKVEKGMRKEEKEQGNDRGLILRRCSLSQVQV